MELTSGERTALSKAAREWQDYVSISKSPRTNEAAKLLMELASAAVKLGLTNLDFPPEDWD